LIFLTDVEGTAMDTTFKGREIQEEILFQDAEEHHA
jgi:hypothetical protein